jgi:hypothetical protein
MWVSYIIITINLFDLTACVFCNVVVSYYILLISESGNDAR